MPAARLVLRAVPLAFALTLAPGCEEEAAPLPADNAPSTSSEAGGDAASSLQEQAQRAADDAEAMAGRVVRETEAAAEELGDEVEAAAANAEAQAEQAQARLVTQAESLYQRATSMLGDGNIEQAKQALSKLQEIKAQLPESWQTRIDDLAKQVENLPGNLRENLGL